MNIWDKTQLVKQHLSDAGFQDIGIAKAEKLDGEERKLTQWLNANHHGSMAYMENHFDLRLDPGKLQPGTKTVISISYNYFTEVEQTDPEAPKISKYAYGRDYHKVIKKRLKAVVANLRSEIGEFEARICVDSAPILERAWAQKSGLGWIGKNTMVLTKGKGSLFFLAEILTDLELLGDGPVKDYCGQCTKCIDACPTGALFAPYQMDGSKCISYFTIENKSVEIPYKRSSDFQNWMYGCDICQDVCPINARAKQHQEEEFNPKPELMQKPKEEWEQMTEEEFDELFTGSAVKRAGYKGLKRNIKYLSDL